MTEEELLALGFPTVASSVFEEGEEYRTIQVTVADGVVLDALFASKVLHRFTLTSPRVTDSLGLGVGTSLGELRKSYSNGRLFIGYEAGKHANFVSDSKVIYRLDLKSIDEACFEAETRDEQRYASEKCVGEDVRVKSLVVTLSAG